MTFEKVKEIIIDTISCDASKVTLDARLTEDLEADSLDALELNCAIEEEFGITIDETQLASMKTVKDIVDFIDNQN